MNIRELSFKEQSAFNDGLSLASRLVGEPLPLSVNHVQSLYDALLETERDFPEGVLALGLAFGELIAKNPILEWVRVSDEYGEETCLGVTKTQLICSPISMIQKRLNDRQIVNIEALAKELCEVISEKYKSADYRPR